MSGGHYNYWVALALLLIGLYGVLATRNLVKQVMALAIFQTGVFVFYLSVAVKDGGGAPVWRPWRDQAGVLHPGVKDVEIPLPGQDGPPVDHPLNHVLILTAIVVSVSTLAVALALIVNIKRSYGSIEEDDFLRSDRERQP